MKYFESAAHEEALVIRTPVLGRLYVNRGGGWLFGGFMCHVPMRSCDGVAVGYSSLGVRFARRSS